MGDNGGLWGESKGGSALAGEEMSLMSGEGHVDVMARLWKGVGAVLAQGCAEMLTRASVVL